MGAHAAAKAMIKNTDMDAVDIVKEAMKIVASLCVFTNDTITIEEF
jgi:ATP-dependent HslUV protease subunit HslV